MVQSYKKKDVPSYLIEAIHPLNYWKFMAANDDDVIDFYFLKDGKLDGIAVERLQTIIMK